MSLLELLIAGALAACATASQVGDGVVVVDRLLPAGGQRFTEPGSPGRRAATLYYWNTTVADGVDPDIIGLLRTTSGIFLRIESENDPRFETSDVVYWDGEALSEVSSGVASFEVSADRRYAGWWERDSRATRGGLDAIRVVDLATGRAVVRTSEGMGDPAAGADELATLYANAWPNFSGFDAENRVYWHRASVEVEDVRYDLGTGTGTGTGAGSLRTGTEESGVDQGEGCPRSMLWSADRGYEAL